MRPQKDADFLDHDYDGIRELNNPMPTWWTSIFWGTSVFAIIYVAYYHFGPGRLVAEEYAQEVAVASAAAVVRDAREAELAKAGDSLEVLAKDPMRIKAGNMKFVTNCAVCHGERGEGKIGPNLTDSFWIHGNGSLDSIWKSVDEGYPAMGMLAWGKVLKPDDMKSIVAFVGSIRSTNAPGGKAPQGPRTPEEEAALLKPAIAP